MAITEELIKELVKRSESESLDVKGAQYSFKNADDDDKAEILKDILAFANGFASQDAYILLGVRQVDPPPHTFVGISDNIDEASIQGFVNAKALRCPRFSYGEVSVDGLTVGVIQVPRQNGPFTLKRDFGGLKQNEVPLRRGTGTEYPSFDQYLQLKLEHDRATYTNPAAQQVNATVDKALQSRLVRMGSVVAESAGPRFERCNELLRFGDLEGAMEEIERVLANRELMQELTDDDHARAFRVKANLLLRNGDLSAAEDCLREADALAEEVEPRIHAVVALHRSGVREAIRVLGEPISDDGRQLAAQFFVADGRPDEALAVLPSDEPIPTNSLRARTLTQLMLGLRDDALATAKELMRREPAWLDSPIIAGMAHYFSALSPALTPKQVVSPDPVPPPLVRSDPTGFDHLRTAEQYFREALGKKIQDYEVLNLELWLLAVLALQADRREDANDVLNSIFTKSPTDTIAVFWAISHGLSFDRDKIRERCIEALNGINPEASQVVTYLALDNEPTEQSLSFLTEHRELFEKENQTKVFDFWHACLNSEINRSDSEFEHLSPNQMAALASESDDWSFIQALVDDNPDDPIALVMALEAFAEGQRWLDIVQIAGRLVKDVATEYTYRLVATAYINSGDAKRCLEVVDEWMGRFKGNQLPAVEFWRLRSSALTRIGDVAGAIESATTMLKQASSPRDVGHAADIFLRVGDVRSAAPHIASLMQQDKVSPDEAINWSRAVQHDDQKLAQDLLYRAAEKGVSPAMAGSAYDMSVRLKRDDLREKFLGELAAAADQPGTGIQSASLEDIKSWMHDRQAHVADVNKLYLKGQIPLAMACSAVNDNIMLRFEAAFSAYRTEDWMEALLIYHGSRVHPTEGLPEVSEWVVCLDITTLVVLDELGLLQKLQKSVKRIKLPFELPGALLEIEDQLALRQPERLATLASILKAVDTGRFRSGDAALQDDEKNRARRVVFEPGDQVTDYPLVGLKQVFEAAIENGTIDAGEAAAAIRAHSIHDDPALNSDIPKSSILQFDGNTIEIVLEVFGLERLNAFATCIVESEYARIIRNECELADLRQKALERVVRLRHTISAAVQNGDYELMPEISAKIVDENSLKSSLDASLFSLLGHPPEPGCVVAFDDRLLNKHRSTTNNPIVCTLDILEYLRKSGDASTESFFEVRSRLRDNNLYFAIPEPEEILAALAGTRQNNDGALVESLTLKALRRYVVRLQSLQQNLDIEQHAGQPNEAPLALATFRLAANAIEATFGTSDIGVSVAKARATWIWESIHQSTDSRLPLFNRTPASVRYVLAVQLSSLLSSAMTTFMVSRRSDRDELMRSQIEWAWDLAIAPYLEGNNDLLPAIAEYLRACTDPLLDRSDDFASAAEREEVERFTRAHVAHFVTALPKELRENMLNDEIFASRFGVGVESVAEIEGVMIEEIEFRDSLIEAIRTGMPVSLETKEGRAEVRVIRRGTRKRPPVVEYTGAVSLNYAEPLLSIFGEDRNEKLAAFLRETNLIDLPPNELGLLRERCETLSDGELYSLLDRYRRENVQHSYQRLADAMSRQETLSKPDFDAPPPLQALKSMRIPAKTRKRFSFLLDLAIESLVDQYGPIEALDRLSGFPVDLASRLADSFSELVGQEPRKTKRWLLSINGSVMSRMHKLAICAALAERGELTIAAVRKSLRQLLQDWSKDSGLYVQILRTTSQLQSHNPLVVELGVEQRLSIVWSHAERLARIINQNSDAGDDGVKYFKKIADQTLASLMRIDRAYETDASSPVDIYPPTLLLHGMGYVHSHCSRLISSPLMRKINNLLRFSDDSLSPLSPRLLQGRFNAPDTLESILKSVDLEFFEQFNIVNKNRAQPATWFDQRETEVEQGAVSLPPDRQLWTEVLAFEQKWLAPKTRTALLVLVESIDWSEMVSYSEDAAICLLMVSADMIAYIENEADAIRAGAELLSAAHSGLPLSQKKSTEETGSSWLTFEQALGEAAYRVARSSDMGRSCRVLAANLRMLVELDIMARREIAKMLEIAIPMLPVQHVLPLAELRQSIRTRT